MIYLRVTASFSLAEMGLRRRVTFFRIFGATMLSSLSYTLGVIRNVEKKKECLKQGVEPFKISLRFRFRFKKFNF